MDKLRLVPLHSSGRCISAVVQRRLERFMRGKYSSWAWMRSGHSHIRLKQKREKAKAMIIQRVPDNVPSPLQGNSDHVKSTIVPCVVGRAIIEAK